MKTYQFLFTSLFFANTLAIDAYAQTNETTVTVVISNIKSNKGNLRLGLFKTQEEFEKEQPFKKISISKAQMSNGSLSANLQLPEGTYGISVLDDENNNAKMDYNMVRMPKEGFGFSNYYHTGLSKPKLSQFVFTVSKGNIKINCKMRYI